MTKEDRKKLSILVTLFAILGVTVVFGYRMIQPPSALTVQPAETKAATTAPLASDSQIRLDWLEQSKEANGDIGKKNLFQYQQAPPRPLPTPPPGTFTTAPGTQTLGSALPPTTSGPPRQPQPPQIALKYQGLLATNMPTRTLIAVIADDARHYNVTVGETLMGRYRIVSITDKTVEVEDLDNNRRQILPFLK